MDTRKVVRKIYSIEVEQLHDDSPDTSWLGEYSNTPETEYAIERENVDSRKYRYFNGPIENYKRCTPDEIREYIAQDYRRMEGLNQGDWHFIGIRALAEVGVSLDGGQTFKITRLTSSGLWGIESDSDAEYMHEVENEQLAELKQLLSAYGFGRTAIAKTAKEVTR